MKIIDYSLFDTFSRPWNSNYKRNLSLVHILLRLGRAQLPQTRYLLNGCATVKGNVTSGGQPVFINCRDTKMNNFTSSAQSLAESTFLIYVQINAAWKKIIWKGRKKRGGRRFIARVARFSRPNLWFLCQREDRVTSVLFFSLPRLLSDLKYQKIRLMMATTGIIIKRVRCGVIRFDDFYKNLWKDTRKERGKKIESIHDRS